LVKVALKGLATRKLRAFLTGFAVVLGVAFVAGTFIFTDAIDASFKDLFERASKGTDVSVQSREAVEVEFEQAPPMPADTLARVQAVDGVDEAVGSVSYDRGTLLDRDGDPITSNGPPTLILSAVPERFDPLDYVEGGPPKTADEVVLDKATADENDFHEGSTVTVSGTTPAKQYKVVGVAKLGESNNLGGARMVQMTLPEAQRVAGYDGYDDISVAAAGGTSPEELKARISAALGRNFAVRTGKEQVDKEVGDFKDDLAPIRTSLLVFAGVSVLVGGFLIFNTFNITVAQRAREIALLRMLGASRPQVMRSVLAETLAIGLVASIVGILLGVLVARLLTALFGAIGLDLGNSSFPLEPRTIITGLAVGLLATIVSGWVPARRATRIEPIAALRDADTAGTARLRRRRVVAAALLAAAGIVVMLYALFGDLPSDSATASSLGVGAVLLMFGFALVAASLVRPMARAIGKPLERLQGLTGRLARENAQRQPQRTATTASALMIGVALVVFVAIFAAGIKATIDQGIDNQVRAAGIVTSQNGFEPIPDGVVDQLRGVDGVAAVSPIRLETGKLVSDGKNVMVSGIDPANAGEALSLDWTQGSNAALSQLGDSDVIVNQDFADSHDVKVGDELAFITRAGKRVSYRVTAIYDANVQMLGLVTLTDAAMVRDWDSKEIQFALVTSEPGTDAEALKRAEETALVGFPTAKPQTIQDFKDQQYSGLDTIVYIVYLLLALSVLVALLGVINTLALSVHERTRELGMLRAVGMSRRQVRQMIRGESVITAGIGAVLGIVLGTLFALIVSRPLAHNGFVFTIPIVALIVVFVIAALAGVAAAIQPARRAAKVDVLRAVTTE
jgi:putative ABC transport system permease protein